MQLDIDRLADREGDVDFSVALAELPRLRSRLAGAEGSVRGHVHFARASGLAVAELSLTGTASLQCQRCMERMEVPVETRARVALIPTEADANRVPDDLEPMLAPGGRIAIPEMVEEELMLFLPIVPLHGNPAECAAGADSSPASGAAAENETPTMQRPFERLQELLKRK